MGVRGRDGGVPGSVASSTLEESADTSRNTVFSTKTKKVSLASVSNPNV